MLSMLINGLSKQTVSVLDRGLQYADGLFETVLVESGRAIFINEHLARLENGCQVLGFGVLNKSLIQQEIQQLIGNKKYGIVKIVLTRGVGERGFLAPSSPELTRVISFDEKQQSVLSYQKNIHLTVCNTRLSQQPQLAGIKHLAQLERVLARSEWVDNSIKESLMLDTQDWVIEGTMSNIFIVKEGVLITPDLTQCGINGIMRDVIIANAIQENKPYQIKALTLSDIEQADEVFMTNSLMPVWLVSKLILKGCEVNFTAGIFCNWVTTIISDEITRQSKGLQ